MRTTPPTRLPWDVYDAAATQAATGSRTIPQQIAHWARIGREFEMSLQVNHRAISQVLAGKNLLRYHVPAAARISVFHDHDDSERVAKSEPPGLATQPAQNRDACQSHGVRARAESMRPGERPVGSLSMSACRRPRKAWSGASRGPRDNKTRLNRHSLTNQGVLAG